MAISGYLKQSTAATVLIGPFLDEDDGKTAEDSLTISQADVRLSKNAGNMAQKNESTACTHDELGYYTCPLDTTDTGTLGILTLMVHESGALPIRHDYMVLPANVYDSGLSTDKLQVHVTEMDAGVVTSTVLADNAITAAKLNADAITAAKVASDVTTEIQSGLATAAELAKVPKSDGTASWNATALGAIQQEATDALNAYDPPTKAELDSAVDALPTAAENAAALLTASETTPVESNVKKINDVTITGTGTNGDEFQP